MSEITKKEFNESFYKNDYYSVRKMEKDGWIEGYEIKNENTDETKIALKKQFKDVEIVKNYLSMMIFTF